MRINPLIFRYFDGEYFEQLVMEIYSYYGYSIKKTSTTGDQGVDLIMTNEIEKIAVQCKRYKANVNNKAVQEVFAGMHFYKCDKAIVVTSSAFTSSARQLASALGVKLVDCDDLARMLINNNNSIGENFYNNDRLTQILINAGCDLMENQAYSEAIELLEDIVSERTNFLEANMSDLLNAYNYLAMSYRRIDMDKEAEKKFLEGLAISRYTNLLNNLAVLYRDHGRYHEARDLLIEIADDPNDSFNSHFQNHRSSLEKLAQLKDDLQSGLIFQDEYIKAEAEILNKYR